MARLQKVKVFDSMIAHNSKIIEKSIIFFCLKLSFRNLIISLVFILMFLSVRYIPY